MTKLYINILRLIFSLLPKSRYFRLKNIILKITGIDVAQNARIFSTVQIFGPKTIQIGNDTFIGHEVLITGSVDSEVFIGDNVDIAPRVIIGTGTHLIDLGGDHIAGQGLGKSIFIKDGAWIGMGSIILPGVTIGKKAIVAAGSVVTQSVDDNTLVAGNPATFKKRLQ